MVKTYLKFLILPLMVAILSSCFEAKRPIIVDIDKDNETFENFFGFGETGKISETEIGITTYGKAAPSAVRTETIKRNIKIKDNLFSVEANQNTIVELDSADLVGYLNSISTGVTEENAVERLNYYVETNKMTCVLQGGKYHLEKNELPLALYINYSDKIAPFCAGTMDGETYEANVFNMPEAKHYTMYDYIYNVAFNGPRYFDQTDYSVSWGYAGDKRHTDWLYDNNFINSNVTDYFKHFDCFDGKLSEYAERQIEVFENGSKTDNVKIFDYDREDVTIDWPTEIATCPHVHFEDKIGKADFDNQIYNYKECNLCGHCIDIKLNLN